MSFKFNPMTGNLDTVGNGGGSLDASNLSFGSGAPTGVPTTDPHLYIDISRINTAGGATLWGYDSTTAFWYPFRENWSVKVLDDSVTITDNVLVALVVEGDFQYINGGIINGTFIN